MHFLWFWLALTAAFLWSLNNHLDKFLAERYYRGSQALPGTLMFLSSILGAGVAAVIFLVHPALAHVPLQSALLMMAAGAIDFIYVFPYVLALMRDEASRVSPLFCLAPIGSFILARIFLNEQLVGRQIIAGAIIIVGCMAINLDIDRGFRLKKTVFGLMVIVAALVALETFLFKFVALGTGYWPAVLYQGLGIALTGLVLATCSKKYRRSFTGLMRQYGWSVFTYSLAAEALNLGARLALNYASLLAPLALVSLVGNLTPFFVIAIGVILTLFAPKYGTEQITLRHLGQKILCTAVIFGGMALLLTH